MGFFTSLSYFLPRKPPVVTPSDLKQFIERVADTGLLADKGILSLQMKFGDAIDQDYEDTLAAEPVTPEATLVLYGHYPWDVDCHAEGLKEIVHALGDSRGTIYRAHVMLGTITDAVRGSLARDPCAENELGCWLDDCSLYLGPIAVGGLVTEHVIAGPVGVSLSGNGYPFPWSSRDLVNRARTNPQILELEHLCNTFWPVEPGFSVEELRQRMEGEEWAEFIIIPEEATEMTWLWGVQET